MSVKFTSFKRTELTIIAQDQINERLGTVLPRRLHEMVLSGTVFRERRALQEAFVWDTWPRDENSTGRLPQVLAVR